MVTPTLGSGPDGMSSIVTLTGDGRAVGETVIVGEKVNVLVRVRVRVTVALDVGV
jgi:hypothetical protein